jgi:hypothetical protein
MGVVLSVAGVGGSACAGPDAKWDDEASSQTLLAWIHSTGNSQRSGSFHLPFCGPPQCRPQKT